VSRIKRAKPSPAIVVAVVALVAALSGGAVAGVTISKLNKRERNQVRKISKKQARKQARKLDKRIELTPGPRGQVGPKGADAASATYGVIEGFNTSSPLPIFAGVSGTANSASVEGAISMLSPSTTIVARDLAVELDQALSAGSSLTLTLRADSADTTVSCEISGPETNCDSGTASAEIDPRSELSLGITGDIPGPASLRNIRFGWRATTP
jgi:hypothetical protein